MVRYISTPDLFCGNTIILIFIITFVQHGKNSRNIIAQFNYTKNEFPKYVL
jgi:hypothetical protein